MDITEAELRSDTAEIALIGAVAFHPDAIAGVLADLAAEHFYSPHRASVWDICRQLAADHTPIDPVTISRRLVDASAWNPATQRVVQVEMANPAPASHASTHAATIVDLARRRALIRAITSARQIVAEHTGDASEVLAAVRRQFDGLDEGIPARSTTLTWPQLIDEFEVAHAPGGSSAGIPSPWWELDQLLGGLHPGRMYTFGGRPGAGKSTAALNIAQHAAVESGKKVLIFSKEMPTVDVTGRLLAHGAQVSVGSINHRRLMPEQLASIRDYVRKVGNPDIRMNASPVSLEGMKTMARAQHHRTGLDLLVVDYLQLVRSEQVGRNREQEVGRVSSELKMLAMELGIVVILPAQLNRGSEARADKKPTMADLRDSGQIEQDSDAVILLWHELNPHGESTGYVTLIVDKNRHGARSEIKLRWHGGYGGIG